MRIRAVFRMFFSKKKRKNMRRKDGEYELIHPKEIRKRCEI